MFIRAPINLHIIDLRVHSSESHVSVLTERSGFSAALSNTAYLMSRGVKKKKLRLRKLADTYGICISQFQSDKKANATYSSCHIRGLGFDICFMNNVLTSLFTISSLLYSVIIRTQCFLGFTLETTFTKPFSVCGNFQVDA